MAKYEKTIPQSQIGITAKLKYFAFTTKICRVKKTNLKVLKLKSPQFSLLTPFYLNLNNFTFKDSFLSSAEDKKNAKPQLHRT